MTRGRSAGLTSLRDRNESQQAPIGEYALVGDTRTAGLISRSGSMDWLCVPRFDADPVFGAIIDADSGGRFEVSVEGTVVARQYHQDSAVLETRWRGLTGAATVTDAMPVNVKGFRPQMTLIRHVECTAGDVTARVLFDPRLGLPGRLPRCGRRSNAMIFEWGSLALLLQCFPGDPPEPRTSKSIELHQGESLTLIASLADRTPAVFIPRLEAIALLEETDREWRRWVSEIQYSGPFRPAVVRSLVTLRLLTYSPSGAPVAAPTMSLPEKLGGELNWDYRYAWPRDAGIGSGAFIAAGRTHEAQAFLRWLEIASRLSVPKMHVLYTLDGTPGHREREIAGVSGYRGSLPVRAANAAAKQHQLDVYGWVVDTAWHLVSHGTALDRASWRMIRSLADQVASSWRAPDAGIWEDRGQQRHHVSSRFMAFVALDRASRMARRANRDEQRVQIWEREREALRRDVFQYGWNPTINSYVAAYGSEDLDASVLLVAMAEIDDDRPEHIRQTIDAVRQRLGAGGVLVYRHLASNAEPPDEGAFLACTFWLIDALARCGRVEEAEALMVDAIALGGELGLLAEEVDPATGEMLGNHPQALSHSTLVAAALSIEAVRASGKSRG